MTDAEGMGGSNEHRLDEATVVAQIEKGMAAGHAGVLRDAADAEAEFRTSVVRTLRIVATRLDEVAAHGADAQQRHRAAQAAVDQLVGEMAQLAEAVQRVDALRERLDQHAAGVDACLQKLGAYVEHLGEQMSEHRTQHNPVALDYFEFESRFRGSVADIKQRHTMYLELFVGRTDVVDVACGRGEFVELLHERGIPVRGVDLDEDMVKFCRRRGLPVETSDAFDYLKDLRAASVDGLFTAQFVEHLHPTELFELVDLSSRALRSGGLIVAETVNPSCPHALGKFYVDPTHVRPVPPALLGFAFERSGLSPRFFRFSSPTPGSAVPPTLDNDTADAADAAAYQDYAIVGEKL